MSERPKGLRDVELNRMRLFSVAMILALLIGPLLAALIWGPLFLLLEGYTIFGAGLIVAALVYDVGTAIGQRNNFIEDCDKRGMGGSAYAERLRGEKV